MPPAADRVEEYERPDTARWPARGAVAPVLVGGRWCSFMLASYASG